MKYKAIRPLTAATFVALVRPTRFFYIALLAAALTAYTHGGASAVGLYAHVSCGTANSVGPCTLSSGPGFASATAGNSTGSLLTVGSASPGDLSAEVDTQANVGGLAGAAAQVSYSDYFTIVTTDPNAPSTIPVSMNAVVDGFLNAAGPHANSTTYFAVSVLGLHAQYGIVLDTTAPSFETCSSPGFSGSLCPANLHTATLTTATFNAPINTAFLVEFDLQINVLAGAGSTASSEILNSFRLPYSFEDVVFNGLPNDYTVDAPDSFVSNNRFLPPTAATPLPAALPLFASGLGALGLLGWRRRRKAQAAA